MVEYNIAVMPGDFCGKEFTPEALKVLRVAADKYGFSLKTEEYPHSGEHTLKTGEIISDSTIRELEDHAAILFGAVGHPDCPREKKIERSLLLKLRFDLDQYINLRPSKLYEGVDAPIKKLHPDLPIGYEIIFVREGVKGLYRGKGGIVEDEIEGIIATQIMEYSSRDVDRMNRYAFELAREKNRDRPLDHPMIVLLAGKTNVLDYVFDQLWEPRFHEMGDTEFPDVMRDYVHIDALNGPLLIDHLPNKKDGFIVVTSNMFGDIITDLTASLFGGMGIGYSGCINPDGISMFEPIGGSSPKDYGKNVICPIAAILSGRMMLEHLGEEKAAQGIEDAVAKVLREGKIPNLTTESGVPTQKQTEYVIEALKEAA